jgi:hypothetical protein
MSVIARVAGTGQPGISGDGGPAAGARLGAPAGVAMTGDGGFLIADFAAHMVRRVSAAGVITTVAGAGRPGNSGDGGPATAARLNSPEGIAPTPDGGFLIADMGNHVIRKVSAAGVITTVAGTGVRGYAGDGGPATGARLNAPVGVAVTRDGGFLIGDFGNHVVRKVSASGVITTVAGTGAPGSSGDGGPATQARLATPAGVAVTGDDGFLVSDNAAHVVRMVSAAGVISTVAGTGAAGNSGDGGPATAAQLNNPNWVAAGSGGRFLIADFGNHVVRAAGP